MVLMDPRWRDALSRLISILANNKSRICLTYTPEAEVKVKVAALEAAKRLSFRHPVVIFTSDSKTEECIKKLRDRCLADLKVPLSLRVCPCEKEQVGTSVISVDFDFCQAKQVQAEETAPDLHKEEQTVPSELKTIKCEPVANQPVSNRTEINPKASLISPVASCTVSEDEASEQDFHTSIVTKVEKVTLVEEEEMLEPTHTIQIKSNEDETGLKETVVSQPQRDVMVIEAKRPSSPSPSVDSTSDIGSSIESDDAASTVMVSYEVTSENESVTSSTMRTEARLVSPDQCLDSSSGLGSSVGTDDSASENESSPSSTVDETMSSKASVLSDSSWNAIGSQFVMYDSEAETEVGSQEETTSYDFGDDDDGDSVEQSLNESEKQLLEDSQYLYNADKIEISDEQLLAFKKTTRVDMFYEKLIRNTDHLIKLLKESPDDYKRCRLTIDTPHQSYAEVLDEDHRGTSSTILICGRSKCNRTYMDDIVVVRIIKPKKEIQGEKDTKLYGYVIGLLKRERYADITHPVFFCTLDEFEGHLMRPLCKTVPKIHVLNDRVKLKFPTLTKSKIDIKEISGSGRVEHKAFVNIKPDKREQYVFAVVLLLWSQQSIYPLGAVLGVHLSGTGYSEGVQVLAFQHRIPGPYPRDVLHEPPTQDTIKRVDITNRRLFTVDHTNSKDLNNALSVWKHADHYVVGVHVADVTSVVKENTPVDEEAKKRGVAFYPFFLKPHYMLPELLSEDLCSLKPGTPRPALSVLFKFNKEFEQVGDPKVLRTEVKSEKSLIYDNVEAVLRRNKFTDLDKSLCMDIHLLHEIAEKLRQKRQTASDFSVSFDDPRLADERSPHDHKDASALVKEFVILTNSYIAKRLSSKFPTLMILRCQKKPSFKERAEWRDKAGGVAHLVMELQGQQITPDTKLSYETQDPGAVTPDVIIQTQLWKVLRQHIENGKWDEARRLAFMDDLHPLQCLANYHWIDLLETAQYKCSQGLNPDGYFHFGLGIGCYTHFTDPIRNYADLHVHRLLHADLDGETPSYSPADVTRLCEHLNSVTARQKAFLKGCLALKIADSLQRQPLVFRTFVDQVDSEQLTLMVPSLHAVTDRKQQLPFSIIGVSSQPQIVPEKKDTVTVKWNKRIYNGQGKCPEEFAAKRRKMLKKTRRHEPLIMTMNPQMLSETVKQKDWVQILQSVRYRNPLKKMPSSAQTSKESVVDFMTTETGDTVSLRPCHFKMDYSRGQVLQVQISAAPQKGILRPQLDLLHTAHNASVCLQHAKDPVSSLFRTASRSTREQPFKSYEEYLSAWMPLLEMEAAYGAGKDNTGVVIEDVPIKLKDLEPDSNSKPKYEGSFKLPAQFCDERCIELGGRSFDYMVDEEGTVVLEETPRTHFVPVGYLCIRYHTQCPGIVSAKVQESPVPEAVDNQFTWIGHAGTGKVKLKRRVSLHVNFVLNHSSPKPPDQLLSQNGDGATLEILPKTEMDRRTQEVLLRIEEPGCEVAQAIAYGADMPKLDKDRVRIGWKLENQDVEGPPPNNRSQTDAITTALTSTVSVIQGPPGTGKTNTGIKLVYLFCKINRQLEKEGKGEKIMLFCGPSNKSVDVVAKLLIKNFGSNCPRMIRMYGSAIESKDYPVPFGNFRTRVLRGQQSDPKLKDVSLHHVIRLLGKPYAQRIKEKYKAVLEQRQKGTEKHQDDPKKQPKDTKHQPEGASKRPPESDRNVLKEYYKLLYKASVEEIQNYEVVLTTCAVAGSNRLIGGVKENVFQVIIDECAMSPEPHSLVPIIATKARQVVLIGDHKQLRPIITCQAAADLGLDQSLFERLYKTRSSIPKTFLSEQYRMHPKICEFPSEEFYNGKLVTKRSSKWMGEPLNVWPLTPYREEIPHILVNVKGTEETLTVSTDEGNERSKFNAQEVAKVTEIYMFLRRRCSHGISKIRVLTQYNAQRCEIEKKLKEKLGDDKKIKVTTVVSSQGDECDYVILSTVRTLPSHSIEPNPTHGWCRQNLGSITDKNQANVALTRARKGIIIVGEYCDVELLKCDEMWNRLVKRYASMHCIRQTHEFPPPPPPKSKHPPGHSRGDFQLP
ncbi:hypothetical protein BaRGS_00018240, partial [Batillaria attramentaria]